MRALLAALVSLVFLAPAGAHAAPGFAEWEVETPGGHLISHIDPLKARHGTCLRKRDATPGLISGRPEDVYVAHVEWWTYHRDHVSGKARDGYFLFDERTGAVSGFTTEALLDGEIGRRGLGAAISGRLTAGDGWQQVWEPALRDGCRRLASGGSELATLDEAARRHLADVCRRLGVP